MSKATAPASTQKDTSVVSMPHKKQAEVTKGILYGDRYYKDGDLLVTMPTYPKIRNASGLRWNTEHLFIVLYDEENDGMRLEPVSWKIAERMWPEKLKERLRETR